MFLHDQNGELVDSEFSFDVLDSSPCIVIESSGGSNPGRGVRRRNPHYNRLLNLLFQRLASAGVAVTRVALDSRRFEHLPLLDRTAMLSHPYPIDLAARDVDEFRRELGRSIATMHRTPSAKSGGNAQKKIRVFLDRVVLPHELDGLHTDGPLIAAEHTPGLTSTETEYIQKARIGQGTFRKQLLTEYGSCPLTGIRNSELLIASHIKPWKVCTNQERLDPQNGILLSTTVDRLFDRGLITFASDGTVRVSSELIQSDRELCGVYKFNTLILSEARSRYLKYHRTVVYRPDE